MFTSDSPLRRTALRLLLVPIALLSFAPEASAQYFGRNKVQYEDFDWQVLRTEHFDIHHYPEEAEAVRQAARLAERWYDRLSSVFQREFFERKSIILYADQSDFQQTTVIRSLIGESTGGVTEALRTRVVLPFTGNWEDTDHVLGHELVHVFQYDILQAPRLREQGGRGASVADIPLWFVEGLAEYLSLGRHSPQTAMWIRDALARDELPTVRQLSRDPRLFPYRWGHAFWAYVGGRWGDLATTRLFVRATEVGLEAAMAEVLGTSSEDFSEVWRASIRESYGPVIERRQTPRSAGTRILPREDESNDIYIAPVLSPDGTRFAFLSTRSLFTFDLYVADARTGEIQGKLLSADANPHFDSLRFLDSAGTWSPDGTKFAVVVATRGDNELAILDVGSRRIVRQIAVEGVGQMWNASWSPDGRSIAVSGSVGGISDLFLIDLESGRSRRLTNDTFADLQPDWSPDGRTIAFVSDRIGEGAGGTPSQDPLGAMGIWLLDVASGRMRTLSQVADGTQTNPRFGPDGRDLYFISDRAGVSDLYRISVANGELFRVTRFVTGMTGIARLSPALTVSEANGRILFSVFHDTRYQIHSLEPEAARGEPVISPRDEAAESRAALLPPQQAQGRSVVTEYLASPLPVIADQRAAETFPIEEYRPRLQLDFIGPSVGVGVSTFGTSFGGDVTAFFSDELGEREVGVSIQGATGEFSEIGGQAYYLNQRSRWQWGGLVGRLPYTSAFTTVRGGTVEVDGEEFPATIIEQERQTVAQNQLAFISRYPLSATRRFEANVGTTYLTYDSELFQLVTVGNTVIDRSDRSLPAPESLQLFQGGVAFVGDSSYFGFTSPVRGRRYRLEVEPTFGDLEFQAVTADYRRYFFARPVTFAVRGLHLGRYGRDAENSRLTSLYLGRQTLVRGYELGDIDLDECTPLPDNPNACPEFDRLVGSRIAVANLELRVPLFGVEGYGLFTLPFLPTELSAFVDAGTAWTEDESPELRYEERTTERVPVVSAGVSARVLLGGFAVLELYYAKPFQRPGEDWVTGFVIAPGW
jgi:Tol biopolymer transport system component